MNNVAAAEPTIKIVRERVRNLEPGESIQRLSSMTPQDRMQVMLDVAHTITIQARIIRLAKMPAAKQVRALSECMEAIHRLVQFRLDSEMFWYEQVVDAYPQVIGMRLAEIGLIA